MNPTDEQLRDPKWWDEVAPEWATHYVISHCATPGGWYELKGIGAFKMFYNSEEYEFQIDNYRKESLDVYERPTKPVAPEWDGSGARPPVDTAFEFSTNGQSWEERVMLFDDGITCLMANRKYPANRWHYKCDDPGWDCRPIRTPEQREREEIITYAMTITCGQDDGRVTIQRSIVRQCMEELYDVGLLRKGE